MKLLIICSKSFYSKIPQIKQKVEQKNIEVFLPNCYDAPQTEAKYRGTDKHSSWKASMIKRSEQVISNMDAVLVLNFDKNGVSNYIGGATFLEMYNAFKLGKKIYMYNQIQEGILKDEIIGFSPVILNGDLDKIKV